jgi:hypothetical protein
MELLKFGGSGGLDRILREVGVQGEGKAAMSNEAMS